MCISIKSEYERCKDFHISKDCQFFYICINGVNARRNGCTTGLVFNKETLACDRCVLANEISFNQYNK